MNKSDIADVLSLSCVENYFLGYFRNTFDARKLYVKSFVPFDEVVGAFLRGEVRYENYSLERLQTTAEDLGLTSHALRKSFCCEEGGLNLIRVNRAFFGTGKVLPRREDHYIAVRKTDNGYAFCNNYPLSDGVLSENRLGEIFGGAQLSFRENGAFDGGKYRALCDRQYRRLSEVGGEAISFGEESAEQLRDALPVLKTLRRRLFSWLDAEAEEDGFAYTDALRAAEREWLDDCGKLLALISLQIARKKIRTAEIRDGTEALRAREKSVLREIQRGIKF